MGIEIEVLIASLSSEPLSWGAVILSVGVDHAKGWEAGLGMVSGGTGLFSPFHKVWG